MSEKDVVEQILAASHAIDLMRARTHLVVKTVLGMIEKTDNWQAVAITNPVLYLPGATADWQLKIVQSHLEVRYTRSSIIKVGTIIDGSKLMTIDYCSSDVWTAETFGSWNGHVQRGNRIDYVWESLPAFITWLRQTFPKLEEELKDFLEREKIL